MSILARDYKLMPGTSPLKAPLLPLCLTLSQPGCREAIWRLVSAGIAHDPL